MTVQDDESRDRVFRRVKEQVNLLLRVPLRDAEWRDLAEDPLVAGAVDAPNDESFQRIASLVRHRRRIYGQHDDQEPPPADLPLMLALDPSNAPKDRLRQFVLSALTALDALKRESVLDWRRRYLGAHTIPWDQVEEWLMSAAQEDGPPLWHLANAFIPAKEGADDEPDISKFDINGVVFQQLFLEYVTPDDSHIRTVPTAGGSDKLEELRRISEDLSTAYPWQRAQATLFVLTGMMPLIPGATGSVRYRRLRALSRIYLDIDPALSPRDVGEYYREVRQQVLGSRHRDLDPKNYWLAMETIDERDDQGWEEAMRSWNGHHPEWAYSNPSKFARECIMARQRVLRPTQS